MIEKKRVVDQIGINEQFYDELFEGLKEQIRVFITNGIPKVATEDYEGISREAHSIKGLASSLRVEELRAKLVEIEQLSVAKNSKELETEIPSLADILSRFEEGWE